MWCRGNKHGSSRLESLCVVGAAYPKPEERAVLLCEVFLFGFGAGNTKLVCYSGAMTMYVRLFFKVHASSAV